MSKMSKWEYRGQWSPAVFGRHNAPPNRPFVHLSSALQEAEAKRKRQEAEALAQKEAIKARQEEVRRKVAERVAVVREKLSEKAAAIGGESYLFADKMVNFVGKRPVALIVGETEYPIKNWRDLIIKTCDEVAKNKPQELMDRVRVFASTYISKSPDGMRTPCMHEPSGLYLELYLPPASHVNHAKELFTKCGYDTRTIGLVYVDRDNGEDAGDKPRRRNAFLSKKAISDEEIADVKAFDDDLMANYPNGFDFKESSLRLVETRVGKKMSDFVFDFFHEAMFERTDGLWLFYKMVIDRANLELMVARTKELLENEGAFALDALRAEFEGGLRNVSEGKDFKRFFCKFIADKVNGKVRGHEGWRMCFPEDVSEEDGWDRVANRIRGVLVDAGDAISVDDILLQLPFLDHEVIERMTETRLADVVTLEVDSIRYLKLLEYFYLPEDFSIALKEFVEATEAQQVVTSIVLLDGMLNERYGEGFRVNYGLEDECVFKQVVAKASGLTGYVWKHDMFLNESKKSSSSVIEMFLLGHDGIFHEEDFFTFAKETRGMTNRGMLIATFLRRYCIRISKEWWMSENSFDAMFCLTEADYDMIGKRLNDAVLGKPFVPISILPQAFYDSLPKLSCGDRAYDWNEYLLTSIATMKVSNAVVLNDEPSPYTVTAFIAPQSAHGTQDVVEYVLKSQPQGYFCDCDAAFDYLKANNVRLVKTDKLIAKLSAFIGC